MESAIDPLEFMAVNNNLILNFVWTAVHGFSHPKIDEELEAAERQIVWGFDYGDALSLADDQLITTSPDVRKLHEEMVRQQDAEREKRLFGRRWNCSSSIHFLLLYQQMNKRIANLVLEIWSTYVWCVNRKNYVYQW